MAQNISFVNAIDDFRKARRKAGLQAIISRITGDSTELLSYESVRQKLRLLESSNKVLQEIPLDAIVGSVGRYKDFSRNFLPLEDSDQDRWARVMATATGLTGMPPIEVYQIGEAYFVLDGNHRVSVARELGAKNIQAFVREVRTRVKITLETKPDDLIIKAEQLDFFEQTQLDILHPETNFETTNPGRYPILLEHIEVHRYFMGIDEKREISYQEAVNHWHNVVYYPVIQIIRERGIMRHFPERTETDLYVWVSQHRARLENTLEWQVDTDDAISDLEYRFSSEFSSKFTRLLSKIYDALTPDALEPGPAPGAWREDSSKNQDSLLGNILVLKGLSEADWPALDQAIIIDSRESGQIQGLHVAKTKNEVMDKLALELAQDFDNRCQSAGANGHLAIESGSTARIVCDRSHWTDLIVTKVSYPPGDSPIARFGSGMRTMIRRCPRPFLAVPGDASNLEHALLAYNGTPKSKEALYLAAYLGAKWGTQLSVLIIKHEEVDFEAVNHFAKDYLAKQKIKAHFIHYKPGNRGDIILNVANENQCDFILMGGYKSSPVFEVIIGSVVDDVLRGSQIPLLICR